MYKRFSGSLAFNLSGVLLAASFYTAPAAAASDAACANFTKTMAEAVFDQTMGRSTCKKGYDYYLKYAEEMAQGAGHMQEVEKQRRIQAELGPYHSLDQEAAEQRLKDQTGLSFYQVIDSSPGGWETARQICTDKNAIMPGSGFLEQHRTEVAQFIAHQRHNVSQDYSPVVYIGDQINGQARLWNGPIDIASWHYGRIICKQASAQEMTAFKEQEQNNLAEIEYYAVSGYLDYWQRVVESDNESLEKLYDYSSRYNAELHLILANTRAKFRHNGQHYISVDSPGYYDDVLFDLSQNQYEWAISPDAGQQQSYMNRMQGKAMSSPRGLTETGLKKLVENIKRQPLFQALDNLNAEAQDYKVLVTGSFQSRNGQSHTVSIHIRPTYSYVAIDSDKDY